MSYQAVDGCVGGTTAKSVIAGVTKDAMVAKSWLEGFLFAVVGVMSLARDDNLDWDGCGLTAFAAGDSDGERKNLSVLLVRECVWGEGEDAG